MGDPYLFQRHQKAIGVAKEGAPMLAVMNPTPDMDIKDLITGPIQAQMQIRPLFRGIITNFKKMH